jgi:transcriptional regulator with XRE-family HTH domain
VSQPTTPGSLPERLRALRVQHQEIRLTQPMVAAALGVKAPSVSSWESGAAVPTRERLRDYALLFATERSFAGGDPVLLDESDLTDAEERRRQTLLDELARLRDQALRPEGSPEPDAGSLGGRFWYFPDGAPITIITTQMFQKVVDALPYANAWHPNHMASLQDADRDATIELYGHIRAENPTADVRFKTADQATQEDLLGHVVVLGQGDLLGWGSGGPAAGAGVLGYLAARLELPLGTQLPPGGNPEYDSEFVVTLDDDGVPTYVPPGDEPVRRATYRPRWLRESGEPKSPRLTADGYPLLQYDVALLARKPNELNLATTVTVCSGIFSRGTYGAVRALTDPALRSRNEAFLHQQFGGTDDFWLLTLVPVFRGMSGLGTVTPDLARPLHFLRGSR